MDKMPMLPRSHGRDAHATSSERGLEREFKFGR
jgi:hypothetical protein